MLHCDNFHNITTPTPPSPNLPGLLTRLSYHISHCLSDNTTTVLDHYYVLRSSHFSLSHRKNYIIIKSVGIFNYFELKNKTLKTLNRNFPKHLPLITQIIKFRRYLLDPFYSFCNHFRTKKVGFFCLETH